MFNVLIFFDEPGWAWWHRAHNIKKNISPEFAIDILKIGTPFDHRKYDLVVLFESYLYDQIATVPPEKVIVGSSTLQTLSSAVARYTQLNFAGFVVNNLDAYQKIARLANVFCCQNGVDDSLFHFKYPRNEYITACWVGNNISKNNKGLDIICQSCDMAGVKLIALDQSVNVYEGKVLTQEQVRDDVYHNASCYICASEMEGTPNPALEALACGLPVIATRVGNMPEIIVDGFNGFLVHRGVESIAEALEKLKHSDLRQMSLNARNSILNGWTWKQQVLKYEHMFRTLVSQRAGEAEITGYNVQNSPDSRSLLLPIQELYPRISTCSDKSKALFYAYVDYGNNLLSSDDFNYERADQARQCFETALETGNYDDALVNTNLALVHARMGEWDTAIKRVFKTQLNANPHVQEICQKIKIAFYGKDASSLANCAPLTFDKHETELFSGDADSNRATSEGKAASNKSYDLVTISFFHKRMHLARRMLDTLARSNCPGRVLHLFLVDRDPEMLALLEKEIVFHGRDIGIHHQTEILGPNPYYLHMNWVMDRIKDLDFNYIAIIDSDFELHSQWFEKTMGMVNALKEQRNVRFFTAFNNCNGTGWRHATQQIYCDNESDCYGIKFDFGSGQVLMEKSTFYELGPMDSEYQDLIWNFMSSHLGFLTATTTPSYAQHIGASSSLLHHDAETIDYLDTALDFAGDYTIPLYLCGVWTLTSVSETPFFIHGNGLVTSSRDMSFSTIIGHVSCDNNTGTITFANDRFSFNLDELRKGSREIWAIDRHGIVLKNLDRTDLHRVWQHKGFDIFKIGELYVTFTEKTPERIDNVYLNMMVGKNAAITSKASIGEVVGIINGLGFTLVPFLEERDYYKFNIVRYLDKIFALSFSLGTIHIQDLDSDTTQKLVNENLIIIGSSIEEVKSIISDRLV